MVYVQATPVSIPNSAKKFLDLGSCEFRLSQSSKAALAFASKLGLHEVVAVGFSPVLREALARGATSSHTVPLCADPLEQSSFFPKDEFSHVIIGENPDWIFTGSSLAGIICESRKMQFHLFQDGDPMDFAEGSVILVKDSGLNPSSVDIRRIKNSFESSINPEGLLGDCVISKREARRSESLSGEAGEIASSVTRRIRRAVRV